MTEKPKNLSYRQRWELAMEKKRKQPPTFAGIHKDEYDRVGPMDFYMSGVPRYEKLTVPMVLGVGAIVASEVLKEPTFNLDAATLNMLAGLQNTLAIGVAILVVVLTVLFQTGAFTHIWAQLEPAIMHDPVSDFEDVTAMRIREPPACLWWPGREKVIEEEAKKLTPAVTDPASSNPSSAEPKPSDAKNGKPSTKQPDIVLPDLPSGRLSSVNDLIALINAYRNISTIPQIPRGQEVTEIQQRFVEVCKNIKLDFYVNLLKLYGDREIIFISKNKLVAENPGDSKPDQVVELLRYPRVQRTFGYQRTNPGAMRVDLTRLTLYTNYTFPPQWRRMLPGWQAQLNLFPVYYVSGSAGQVKMVEKNITRNLDTIDIQRIQDVAATYQISLVPRLLDDLKIVTEQLDRKDKSWTKLLEEIDYDLKQTVYWLLSTMSRMKNVGKTGLGKSIRNALSNNALKLILYIVLILAGAFVLATLFPYLFVLQTTPPPTTTAFLLPIGFGSMQLWDKLMQMTKESTRARDMAVGETTSLMDRFMVFTGIVFPGDPGPAELAYIKSIAESWLVWALSERPHPPLALLVHKMIRDCESQQAAKCGVPEAKYLPSGGGYPMAAIGTENTQGFGLDDLPVTEPKKDADAGSNK